MKTEQVKHTPGPWSERKWNCDEHQVSALGGTIALVSHTHSLVPDEQADANARLIAAAPELLAALNRALPWLGRLIADGGHLNSVAPNDAIGAMNQAQAAIDKATGNV